MKKHKLLKDPLHWVGWLLSTSIIGGTLYLMKPLDTITSFWIIIGIIFLEIVIVDTIKHYIKLQ